MFQGFLFFLSCFKDLLSQFLGVACPFHNGSLKWSFYHEWIRYPCFTFFKFVILQLGFNIKWLETILLCTFLIRKKSFWRCHCESDTGMEGHLKTTSTVPLKGLPTWPHLKTTSTVSLKGLSTWPHLKTTSTAPLK